MGHGHDIQVDSLTSCRGLEFQSSSRRFGPGSMSRNLGFSMDWFRFRSFYPVVHQDIKTEVQMPSRPERKQRISHNFVRTPEVQYNFTPFVLSCTWLIWYSTFEGHDGGGGGQARREGCVSMGSLAWGGSLQQYYAWICNWHATDMQHGLTVSPAGKTTVAERQDFTGWGRFHRECGSIMMNRTEVSMQKSESINDQ